jgi:DnaJ family protein A protein 2
MTNLYQILGLENSASGDDIKKAYKKLAVQNHPDKGGDEKKFQEISNAYDILSDPKKKQDYDNSQNGHHHASHADIFAHFFGRNGMPGGPGGPGGPPGQEPIQKCNDIVKPYKITLRESFTGVKKTLKIKLKAYHLEKLNKCDDCNGMGRIKNIRNMGIFQQVFEMQCNSCNGIGSNNLEECAYEIERILELHIPKGVHNNNNICIDGCGEQPKAVNKKPGNLIFNIEIADNDAFIRNGDDLNSVITINFIDSICGANINFNIMDEDTINFNTSQFNIVHPNKKYEFKEKGMPILGRNARGNLYIEFKIEYPILTDEQKKGIKELLTT